VAGGAAPQREEKRPAKKEIRFSQRERRAFSFHPQSKQPPKAVLLLPHTTFLTSLKARPRTPPLRVRSTRDRREQHLGRRKGVGKMGKGGEGRQRGMGSSPDFFSIYFPRLTSPYRDAAAPLLSARRSAEKRIDSRRRDPLATARVGTAAGGRSGRWRRVGPAGGAYDGERAVSLRLLSS
jgi:hypothetical protein